MLNKITKQDKLFNLVSLYSSRVSDQDYDKIIEFFCEKLNIEPIELIKNITRFKFLDGKKGDKNCSVSNLNIFQKYYFYSQYDLFKILRKKIKTNKPKQSSSDKTNYNSKDLSYLDNYNYNEFTITKCQINNKTYNINNFHNVQNKIYRKINDSDQIINNSSLYITKGKTKGMIYMSSLDLSVPKSDNNGSILEIVTQCMNNDINLKLELISPKNDKIIKIEI